MGKSKPTDPHQLSSEQIFLRFMFRLVLLTVFAASSAQKFAAALSVLLILSAVFCGLVGAMRGEVIFGRVLTHWDEAAAYALIGRLVHSLS
jgi:hypothetical protein